MPICLVTDCSVIVAARGLCQRHYQLARSRGLIQPGERGPAPASVVAELSAPLELETVGTTRPPVVDLTRASSADDDAPINPEAVAALELPRVQRPRIRPAMPAPERTPADVLQPETREARAAFADSVSRQSGIAITVDARDAFISPIDPLLQAYEERDLWQRREAAAVERARTAERERDAARAESSSHLQFIDALLAAAGWKRGADDSDAAKIAHVGQIIAERASWKESWQRRAQELASALGKKPEDASYRECLALVRERKIERTVWHQRITMMMEALPRHLFAGGERFDQMVVGVCKLLRQAEEAVQPLAARYRTTSLGAIVGAALLELERLDAVTSALYQLGAPDAEVGSDGMLDSTPATRIGLLIRYWQDAIRSVLPGNAERPRGERAEPLASLLRDIRSGLEKASEEGAAARNPLQQHVTATPDGGRLIAAEMALDEAKAPAAESLVERIRLLVGAHAQEVAEATERAAAREGELLGHLSAIRQALNVGPPSASDVRPGTPWAEVARIVRARSVQMLEERDQRVALARLVERIAKSTGFAVGPLLGNYGPLEEHISGQAKAAEREAHAHGWLAEHLADSTPVLRALVADGCGFVEPLASLIAERTVPAGPGHELHEERLVIARLFAEQLLSDPCPF